MRIGTLTIGLFVVLGFAGFAGAESVPEQALTGKLDGSPHDMRTRLGITQVCVPCHAPHNAKNPLDGPIWNHALTTQTFTRTSWETGASAPVTLGKASKLCMGCHDGVTAVGSYGNFTGSGSGGALSGGAALGNDLTGSHPVGVEYTGGGVLESATTVASYLVDGKVECTSCHRAHSWGEPDHKFLRVTIGGSQLCRVCHTF